MTLVRGTVLDTPDDPFAGAPMRAEADTGLLVRAGAIVERGTWASLRAAHPEEEVLDLSDGLVLPGFVDTHVHFPQVRVIGGLGMPLLDWLEQCALPEEARLEDQAYAAGVAEDFVTALARAGTTTALVFGAHFAPAVDLLFAAAARRGLRVTSGLVVSDRLLRSSLLTTPERGHAESLTLARRWHGQGRNRYAVIPRFSLSCSDEMLASCRALLDDVPDAFFTSHLNENLDEILHVERLFDCSYTESYDRHGLLGPASVLAHDVHPGEADLKLLAARDASVAHCPTSNAALASGVFPMARHVEAGVRLALGSDVGAGTGFSMLKEGLQAYFTQQQLGSSGYPLTPAHLLHLATSAGAAALGLSALVGDLSVGKRFDAVWLRPAPGSALDVALRHASGPEAALARAFALGTEADVAGVWVDGDMVEVGPAARLSWARRPLELGPPPARVGPGSRRVGPAARSSWAWRPVELGLAAAELGLPPGRVGPAARVGARRHRGPRRTEVADAAGPVQPSLVDHEGVEQRRLGVPPGHPAPGATPNSTGRDAQLDRAGGPTQRGGVVDSQAAVRRGSSSGSISPCTRRRATPPSG